MDKEDIKGIAISSLSIGTGILLLYIMLKGVKAKVPSPPTKPCTEGNTKCDENNNYYECHNNQWQLIEVNSPKCKGPTPTCTEGNTKCIKYDLYTCKSNKWVLKEHNSPRCGFVCEENKTKCVDFDLYVCKNNKWQLKEHNSSTCHYQPINSLKLTANKTDITAGDHVTFNVLINGEIPYNIDTKYDIYVNSHKHSSSNDSSFKMTFNTTGRFSVFVQLGNTKSNIININVSPVPPPGYKFTASNPLPVKWGEKVVITSYLAKIINGNEEPISNQRIKFTLSNTRELSYKYANTNNNGIASVEFTLNPKNITLQANQDSILVDITTTIDNKTLETFAQIMFKKHIYLYEISHPYADAVKLSTISAHTPALPVKLYVNGEYRCYVTSSPFIVFFTKSGEQPVPGKTYYIYVVNDEGYHSNTLRYIYW